MKNNPASALRADAYRFVHSEGTKNFTFQLATGTGMVTERYHMLPLR